MLTANFDESEFTSIHVQENGGPPPEEYRVDKLPKLALLCQWLRDLAGSYGRVTSWWRSPAHNAAVGGVTNSQHERGEAGDLEFPLISLRELAARVEAALADGSAPEFGQCIFYPDTGETHISLPGATKFQELVIGVRTSSGRQYSQLASLDQLPAVPKALVFLAMVVGVGTAVAFFFPALQFVRG
jgi:hypothetical protein